MDYLRTKVLRSSSGLSEALAQESSSPPLNASLIGCSAPESGTREMFRDCWFADLTLGRALDEATSVCDNQSEPCGLEYPLRITILALGPSVSQS